jgi:alpha-beta hydrolase superfamily lysophospholipase
LILGVLLISLFSINGSSTTINSKNRPYFTTTEDYLNAYDLNFENVAYRLEFLGDPENIAVNIFEVQEPAGTIVLLHGLFAHAGQLTYLIRFLIDRNYTVMTVDLPGHGLSSGEKASIRDFGDYSKALEDAINTYIDSLPGPVHFIGHSTGCAAAFEYLSAGKEDPFEKVIFLAPLYRSNYWGVSKFGYYLFGPFVSSVPRWHRKVSSDPDFLTRVKSDPLQSSSLPIAYVKALFKWNMRIRESAPLDRTVYAIQGDKDRVLDWRTNLDFYKSKVANLEVTRIEGARHELTNESMPLRQKAFTEIARILDLPEPGRFRE